LKRRAGRPRLASHQPCSASRAEPESAPQQDAHPAASAGAVTRRSRATSRPIRPSRRCRSAQFGASGCRPLKVTAACSDSSRSSRGRTALVAPCSGSSWRRSNTICETAAYAPPRTVDEQRLDCRRLWWICEYFVRLRSAQLKTLQRALPATGAQSDRLASSLPAAPANSGSCEDNRGLRSS